MLQGDRNPKPSAVDMAAMLQAAKQHMQQRWAQLCFYIFSFLEDSSTKGFFSRMMGMGQGGLKKMSSILADQ
jgi:hypothetical protein